MAPKKKGKTNKLAKMSDEERARYLLHRAGIEEEARRRKQELIARYMKNKLHREEVFTKINQAKINQQWRFILRKLKVKAMRQELQMLILSFARMADSKNAVISRLIVALEESQDQYSRMLQSHMEMITQFLEIGGDRLKKFHDNFEEQKYNLIEQWEEESQTIESNQKESEYNLQLIMFQQEQNMTNYMVKSTYEKKRFLNYTKITMDLNLKDMKAPKQLQLEKIWDELKSVFGDYVSYHAPKIQQYHLLRQKDATYRREINQHMNQLLLTSDVISYYQNQWEHLPAELDQKGKIAQENYESIRDLYLKARATIEESQIKDKKQIMTLTVESYNAIKKLEDILTRGQKILQMKSTSEKCELDGERVLPWKSTDYSTAENENSHSGIMENVEVYAKLENFWFKVNRVNVHAAALSAERDSLKQENKYLKSCLKRFLMETAIGDNSGDNSEVIGRPASMRMYRITPFPGGACEVSCTSRRRPVTCIEASTCNAVQHERRINQLKMKHEHLPKVITRKHCW